MKSIKMLVRRNFSEGGNRKNMPVRRSLGEVGRNLGLLLFLATSSGYLMASRSEFKAKPAEDTSHRIQATKDYIPNLHAMDVYKYLTSDSSPSISAITHTKAAPATESDANAHAAGYEENNSSLTQSGVGSDAPLSSVDLEDSAEAAKHPSAASAESSMTVGQRLAKATRYSQKGEVSPQETGWTFGQVASDAVALPGKGIEALGSNPDFITGANNGKYSLRNTVVTGADALSYGTAAVASGARSAGSAISSAYTGSDIVKPTVSAAYKALPNISGRISDAYTALPETSTIRTIGKNVAAAGRAAYHLPGELVNEHIMNSKYNPMHNETTNKYEGTMRLLAPVRTAVAAYDPNKLIDTHDQGVQDRLADAQKSVKAERDIINIDTSPSASAQRDMVVNAISRLSSPQLFELLFSAPKDATLDNPINTTRVMTAIGRNMAKSMPNVSAFFARLSPADKTQAEVSVDDLSGQAADKMNEENAVAKKNGTSDTVVQAEKISILQWLMNSINSLRGRSITVAKAEHLLDDGKLAQVRFVDTAQYNGSLQSFLPKAKMIGQGNGSSVSSTVSTKVL